MLHLVQLLFLDLHMVLLIKSGKTQLLLVESQVVQLVHLGVVLLFLLIPNAPLFLRLHLELERRFLLLVGCRSVVLQFGLVGVLFSVHLDQTLLLLLRLDRRNLWSLVLLKIHLGVKLLLLLALDLVVDLVFDVFPMSAFEVRLQVQTALTGLLSWDRLLQNMDSQLSPHCFLLCKRPGAPADFPGHHWA